MKRISLFFISILAFLSISCYNPVENTSAIEGKGAIKVILPSPSAGRGILTVALAESNVTGYTIYVFDPTSSAAPISASVAATATSETLNASVGNNYSVIVIALGGDSGGEQYLLGSGEAKNVAVTSGETTSVSVTLEPVDFFFSVSTPPALGPGSSMWVTLNGNAGIDSIFVAHFNWKIYDTATAPPTQAGNGQIVAEPVFKGTPASEYSGTFRMNLGFNVTSTTNKLSMCGNCIYVNEGSASFNLPPYFLGYGYCPSSLDSDFYVDIIPAPPSSTGLNVSVSWGADY